MKRLAFLSLFLLFFSSLSLAQHTRMVMDSSPSFETPVIVTNPEVSRIFYGELDGLPEYYLISAGSPFTLYAGIMVPDIPMFREKRFSVTVRDAYNETILLADEKLGEWVPFTDAVGGDSYKKGPEIKKYVPAGKYTLEVSSSENMGRYALVVGDVDELTAAESIKSLIIIPAIKQRFFGMDFIGSYMNASGAAALVFIILVALILAFSLRHLRNRIVK